MKGFFKTLYGKITAVFLVLLILLGAIQVYITFQSSYRIAQRTDQQLNRELASHMAKELEPVVQDSLPMDRVKELIHYMMVINPKIEIYMLDQEGKILAFFAHPPKKVQADSVSLGAIHQFLNQGSEELILGPDPRNPGQSEPFSAARLPVLDEEGYLYVILGGEQYESALNLVKNSYILRTSLVALLIAVLTTGILGVVAFAYLTKRLRRMNTTVKEFEGGALDKRIDMDSDDEIGQLASSFNRMADKIQSHIEKLKEEDKMRRELVANISHDLRSPLASIHGYLETILIKDQDMDPSERLEHLETILKNTQVLSKLVEDLFELSKLEARQTEPDRQAFSMADLCQDIVMKLKPEARKKDIDLDVEVDHPMPFVYADIGLVERAVTNLLRNALNHTEKGGRIRLRAHIEDRQIRIEVEDNGRGIAEEDLPYIFERFYRGEDDEARTKGSSGLGLAIAQKIIELHESDIQVDTELNEGTTFYFSLPKAS